MSKQLVPNIRFKGFTDDWEQRELRAEATIVAGGDVDRTKLNQSGKYPVIANALTNQGIIGYYENEYRIEAPSVTVTGRGDVGVAKARMTSFTPVVRLLAIKSEHDVNFLEHSINNHRVLVESTGVPQLTSPQLGKYKLYFPKKEEQIQIGNFFKQLDDTIALQERKLESLKETKKAFLQKMFPKNGETTPEIRFPGFTDAWEQRKLGDNTSLITKGTTPKDKSGQGNINFIKVENIKNGEISPVSKITTEEHNNYLKRSKLKNDDILFSIAGTLGRTAVVNESILPANTNQALAIIRGYKFNIYFLITSLNGHVVAEFIRKNPTIGAQPNLSLEQVGNLVISTPKEEEQTKIGNFFKQLDDTIALQEEKLDKMKEMKKGFLQKLFV